MTKTRGRTRSGGFRIKEIGFGVFMGIIFCCSTCFSQSPAQAPVSAYSGAKIYTTPEAKAIEHGIVLVEDGKIKAVGEIGKLAIPENAKIIDCRGMIMTAAFWNCHVHFMEPKWQHIDTIPADRLNRQIREMTTSQGFAHVFDLAALDLPNLLVLRRRIYGSEVLGPDVFTVGVPFTPLNGSPFYIEPQKLPEIGNSDSAVSFVSRQIRSGADGIKVWSASPAHGQIVKMQLDVLQAAVKKAHEMGKPVFAHPSNNAGVAIAIQGGVDILAHVSPDEHMPWTDTTIQAMLQHHMALIPTLKMFKWSISRNGAAQDTDPLIVTALQQLGAYSRAGGEILFGTDVGFMSDYNTEDEFELMGKAGLTYQQILASLTTAPAIRFHLSEKTGKIAVGMDADLVLLSEDPEHDVKAFSKINYTIRRGTVIYARDVTQHP